ncbi:MAG TPA: tyrosine--tRNA ligase [Dehalococcoidales bacterium]
MNDIEKIISSFDRTTDEIFSLDEFKNRLESNKPLRIKYGVDVTAPFLHIGHAVNLWMMRELQELGHKVVFLIGDFTTTIGDPTGKSKTRPTITEVDIKKNSQEFISQVSRVLLTRPEVFEVRRNSEWFSKMSITEFVSLLSMVTYRKLISRDMFQNRIENDSDIYMHEMIYPVMQGYDSVMVNSDLTIVGTDQLFNEMMGRFFQEKVGQLPQVIITTKITPGIDGKEKQSKSLGNYIGITDTPRTQFGKIMSIPDNLIVAYIEVYTTIPLSRLQEVKQELDKGKTNPMVCKLELASALVERYYDKETATQEKEWFLKTFSERETPDEIPVIKIKETRIMLLQLLKLCLSEESASTLRRLVQQGAVEKDGVRLSDANALLDITSEFVLKCGKRRWFRIARE